MRGKACRRFYVSLKEGMPKPRSITMQDLAEATGLSQATVSYALGNKGSLAKETRDLVLKTAKRMGYRPNMFAAALSSCRTQISPVGWPLAFLAWHKPNGSHYPSSHVGQGIRDTAKIKGFQLHEHAFRSAEELRVLLKMLYARGVQGLILYSQSEIENYAGIDWQRFSVVSTGRWDVHSRFHNVRGDSFSNVATLWNQFKARGYQRIGVALCRHSSPIMDDLEREGAIAALQAKEGRKTKQIPPFLGAHADHDGFLAWYREHRPDGLIGFGDGHYYCLKSAGYSIPRDFAFASIQGTLLPGEVAAMSDVDVDIGKTLLRMMDSLIRHHEKGVPEQPETLLIRSTFLPGTSLPSKAVKR